MPTHCLPSDAREALTLYNDRDVLINSSIQLAAITDHGLACPVPGCTRVPSSPEVQQLASHLLADHFTQVKCFAAVLSKLQQQCDKAGSCVLSQEQTCCHHGEWQSHLTEQHLADVWDLAQKLQRSFSYQGMPTRTGAAPAVSKRAQEPIASNPLAFMPRTPQSKESKVKSASKDTVVARLGHEIYYPCPLGCSCRPMHSWQVPGHVLDDHLPLLIQWLHKHQRERNSSGKLVKGSAAVTQPWGPDRVHQAPHQHASVALPQQPASPRSLPAASAVFVSSPTRATLPLFTSGSPPAVNVVFSPPVSPHKSRLHKSIAFTDADSYLEPQPGWHSPHIAAHTSRPHGLPQLLYASSYSKPTADAGQQQEWQIQSVNKPGSPTKQSSITWLTSHLSQVACDLADMRCALATAMHHGVQAPLATSDLIELLQVIQPQLDTLGYELHALAMSPAAMPGQPTPAGVPASSPPPPSWNTAILAAASLLTQLSVHQAALLRRTQPELLTGSSAGRGTAGVLATSGMSQGGESWKMGTWSRHSTASGLTASTHHGVRAFVTASSTSDSEAVHEEVHRGAVRLQQQLGHVLEWVMSVIRTACPSVATSPKQRPAEASHVEGRNSKVVARVKLPEAKSAGKLALSTAAWQEVAGQQVEAGARKVAPDTCVMGSWSLEGSQYQGMTTTWLGQVAQQLHQAAVHVCVLQHVPCHTAVSALQVLLQEANKQGQWVVHMVEPAACSQGSHAVKQPPGGSHPTSHALLWRGTCGGDGGIRLWGGGAQGAIHTLVTTHALFSTPPWYALFTAHRRLVLLINVHLSDDLEQAALEVQRLPLLPCAAQLANTDLYQDTSASPGVVMNVIMSSTATAKLASGLLTQQARLDNAWSHVTACGWQAVVTTCATTTGQGQPGQPASWIVIRKGSLPPGCLATAHTSTGTSTALGKPAAAAAAAPQQQQLQGCLLTVDLWAPEPAAQSGAAQLVFKQPDLMLACMTSIQTPTSSSYTTLSYVDDPLITSLGLAHKAKLAVIEEAAGSITTGKQQPAPAATTAAPAQQLSSTTTTAAATQQQAPRQPSPKLQQQAVHSSRALPPVLEAVEGAEEGLGASWEEQVLGATSRTTPRHVSPLSHSSLGASLQSLLTSPTAQSPTHLPAAAPPGSSQAADAGPLSWAPQRARHSQSGQAQVDTADSAYTVPDFLTLAQALISNSGWADDEQPQRAAHKPALAASKLRPAGEPQQLPSSQPATQPQPAADPIPSTVLPAAPFKADQAAAPTSSASNAQPDGEVLVLGASETQPAVSTNTGAIHAGSVPSSVPMVAPAPGAANGRPATTRTQPEATSPGPHVSTSPGPHVSSSPGPHVSTSPGPHVSSSPGPHVSSSPGPHVSSSPGPHMSSSQQPQQQMTGGGTTASRQAEVQLVGGLDVVLSDSGSDSDDKVPARQQAASGVVPPAAQPVPQQQQQQLKVSPAKPHTGTAAKEVESGVKHVVSQATSELSGGSSADTAQVALGGSSPGGQGVCATEPGSGTQHTSSADSHEQLLSDEDDDMILELLGEPLRKTAAPSSVQQTHHLPAARTTLQQPSTSTRGGAGASPPTLDSFDESLLDGAMAELVGGSSGRDSGQQGAKPSVVVASKGVLAGVSHPAGGVVKPQVQQTQAAQRQTSDELVLFGASGESWIVDEPVKPRGGVAAGFVRPSAVQQGATVGKAQPEQWVADDLQEEDWAGMLLDPDAFMSSLKRGGGPPGGGASTGRLHNTVGHTPPQAASRAPPWQQLSSTAPPATTAYKSSAVAAAVDDDDDDELLSLAPTSSVPVRSHGSSQQHKTVTSTAGSYKPPPGVLGVGSNTRKTVQSDLDMVDAFMDELDKW